jgi:hypothetical protein
MFERVNYKLVEGLAALPKRLAHRDVAGVAVDHGGPHLASVCRRENLVIVHDRQCNFLGWARVTSPCARMASTSTRTGPSSPPREDGFAEPRSKRGAPCASSRWKNITPFLPSLAA